MRDQYQCRSLFAVQPEHEVDHCCASGSIEAAGRLIGQQKRRLGDEGACERNALLFAAGQELRIMRNAPGQYPAD